MTVNDSSPLPGVALPCGAGPLEQRQAVAMAAAIQAARDYEIAESGKDPGAPDDPEVLKLFEVITDAILSTVSPPLEKGLEEFPGQVEPSAPDPLRVDWSEHEDGISDAIQDSIDMDWNSCDGAKAVVRYLTEEFSK